jgi:hypothetical protein
LDPDLPVVTHSLFKVGTGNTLFFIASIIGVAKTNGWNAALSKRIPLLESMKIELPVVNPSELNFFKRLHDPGVGIYYKKYENLSAIVGSNSVYLTGPMQSYKYFHRYKDIIVQQFRFKDEITSEANRLIRDLIGKSKQVLDLFARKFSFVGRVISSSIFITCSRF